MSEKTKFQHVNSFNELVETAFEGEINALCWSRELKGNYAEIIEKVGVEDKLYVLEPDELKSLDLSEEGQLAREQILADFESLSALGASPLINIIHQYERDDAFPFFPTDVYSFHVDRSPVPFSTFLCTYFGAASEFVSNDQATQKILIPEIRAELRALYDGEEAGFDTFLEENFFDLHYQADEQAEIINLGKGNLWRLAIDHPESKVLPCIHRAPLENEGEPRLMLIC